MRARASRLGRFVPGLGTAIVCMAMLVLGHRAYADGPYAGTPYPGTPFTIAANGASKLETVDFDKGGEGVAYHNTDTINAGKQYRPNEGIGISTCNDVGGGYRVSFIATGEWLKYTVQVQQAGKYNISFRISSRGSASSSAGKLHLEDTSGSDLTGILSIPGTNNAWSDVTATGIQLPAGQQVLTLKFDTGGFTISHITFTPANASAPAAPPVAAAAGGSEVVVVEVTDAPAPAGAPSAAPSLAADVFTDKADIGSPKPAGNVTFTAGTYTLRGGAKIGSAADSFYLAHALAADNGQIIAHVTSIDGTGSAGIMFRESATPDAKFAAVLATAGNGVIFQRRTETGGAALSAVAPSAKPPVWIRLTRSGSDFTAAYAQTAEAPAATDWKQIGSAKAVSLSASARAGLAAALNTGSATLGNVSADAIAAAPAPAAASAETPAASTDSASSTVIRLTGQVIGTTGGYKDSATREKAFDGDLNTYFDPPNGADVNAMWCGLDFGAPQRITRISYAPRTGWEGRMVSGRFEASNSPSFTSGVVQLATITTAPPAGRLTTVSVDSVQPYRYFRYVGGTGHLHVAEIEVYGPSGSSGSAAALPEPTPVMEISGKAINLSENALDWVHWGLNGARIDRKVGVVARISDVDPAKSDSFPDNHSSYSWSDGTPTRQITASTTGIYRTTSFRFTVKPGDTQPHTLTVYLGAAGGKGDLVATIGGAVVYADRNRGDIGGRFYVAHTIKFRAGKPSDVLTVEWKQTGGTGNIQLHAAQLQ